MTQQPNQKAGDSIPEFIEFELEKTERELSQAIAKKLAAEGLIPQADISMAMELAVNKLSELPFDDAQCIMDVEVTGVWDEDADHPDLPERELDNRKVRIKHSTLMLAWMHQSAMLDNWIDPTYNPMLRAQRTCPIKNPAKFLFKTLVYLYYKGILIGIKLQPFSSLKAHGKKMRRTCVTLDLKVVHLGWDGSSPLHYSFQSIAFDIRDAEIYDYPETGRGIQIEFAQPEQIQAQDVQMVAEMCDPQLSQDEEIDDIEEGIDFSGR